MWKSLQQSRRDLSEGWKIAIFGVVFTSVLPAAWFLVRKVMNIFYKRVLIKLNQAGIDWFRIKGPGAPPPTEDDLILWAGVRPWLAKRALKIQKEKAITEDFD